MGYFLEVRQHSKLKAEYNDQQKGWKNLLTWIVFPISSDLNDIVNVFLTRDDDVTRPKLLITPIDNIYIGKLISVTVESFCSIFKLDDEIWTSAPSRKIILNSSVIWRASKFESNSYISKCGTRALPMSHQERSFSTEEMYNRFV